MVRLRGLLLAAVELDGLVLHFLAQLFETLLFICVILFELVEFRVQLEINYKIINLSLCKSGLLISRSGQLISEASF